MLPLLTSVAMVGEVDRCGLYASIKECAFFLEQWLQDLLKEHTAALWATLGCHGDVKVSTGDHGHGALRVWVWVSRGAKSDCGSGISPVEWVWQWGGPSTRM